jgi:hypothetical protein
LPAKPLGFVGGGKLSRRGRGTREERIGNRKTMRRARAEDCVAVGEMAQADNCFGTKG